MQGITRNNCNLQQLSSIHLEASYFDRINMTKNGLEYYRKIIAPTNKNDGT